MSLAIDYPAGEGDPAPREHPAGPPLLRPDAAALRRLREPARRPKRPHAPHARRGGRRRRGAQERGRPGTPGDAARVRGGRPSRGQARVERHEVSTPTPNVCKIPNFFYF